MSEPAGIEMPFVCRFTPEGTPIPTIEEYVELLKAEEPNALVGRVEGPDGVEHVVRSQYLGVDHCLATGSTCSCPPGPWIFGSWVDGEMPGNQVRDYRTREEMVTGHREVVAALAAGEDPYARKIQVGGAR